MKKLLISVLFMAMYLLYIPTSFGQNFASQFLLKNALIHKNNKNKTYEETKVINNFNFIRSKDFVETDNGYLICQNYNDEPINYSNERIEIRSVDKKSDVHRGRCTWRVNIYYHIGFIKIPLKIWYYNNNGLDVNEYLHKKVGTEYDVAQLSIREKKGDRSMKIFYTPENENKNNE